MLSPTARALKLSSTMLQQTLGPGVLRRLALCGLVCARRLRYICVHRGGRFLLGLKLVVLLGRISGRASLFICT